MSSEVRTRERRTRTAIQYLEGYEEGDEVVGSDGGQGDGWVRDEVYNGKPSHGLHVRRPRKVQIIGGKV